MNPRVVPSGFLFDDVHMLKLVGFVVGLGLGAVGFLGVMAEADAGTANSKKSKKAPVASYYFRVPHEATTPHLIEQCPSVVMPAPKLMKACEVYVSGSDIKALRCESLDGRFMYLVYKSKEDCLIDREAMLANEG